MPANPSKPCLTCTRQFCLDQKLPICKGALDTTEPEGKQLTLPSIGAEVPDLDNDVGTGKEGDVEARCFRTYFETSVSLPTYKTRSCSERDSPRDQWVVTFFILIVAALLLTAAIRNR